ncbi:MAG TPA: hypothetical protein VG325_02900 [Solirubrobacteraceae bacterium]|jgi:hypothetical protein|nr:hypothetical protein [Solirubrobacteraceae bacterium]
MPKAPVSQAGRVAFELDRFELVRGDCCEVQGRWFGVRGRRFLRPALTVIVDGQPTRLLADLAHKPWAAEDGEPWRAEFPYPTDFLVEAELTVAPDVTIALPAPRGRTPGRRKKLSADGAGSSPAGGGTRGNELAAMRRELVAARDEQRSLQIQLERTAAEKAQAMAHTDELMESLSQLTRERDEARAAGGQLAAVRQTLASENDQIATERDRARRERDKVTAERDVAQHARDEALRVSQAAEVARDGALAERGAAVTAQRQAKADRDAAMAARDQAVSERDAALALRSHALAERDAAVAARDAAVADHDALARTTERLQAELTDLLSARGAAMVMRRAAQERPASRPYGRLLPGAIAIVVLVAVALLIVLGVL